MVKNLFISEAGAFYFSFELEDLGRNDDSVFFSLPASPLFRFPAEVTSFTVTIIAMNKSRTFLIQTFLAAIVKTLPRRLVHEEVVFIARVYALFVFPDALEPTRRKHPLMTRTFDALHSGDYHQ